MRNIKNAVKILAFFAAFTAAQSAFAALAFAAPTAERILRYESVMSVARDSSATVTERLTVNIEGRDIRRGIIRFFPVKYRTETGGRRNTGFELLSVTFDGGDVPHELSREGDYAVIKTGNPKILAPKGEHVYEFIFRVTGHIRFLEDKDGVYWNVTGNQWEFPIDYASFRLSLPEGGEEKITSSSAYTGYAGESGADFESAAHVFFETTRPLRAKEGLTVAVDWEKGVVDQPAPTVLGIFAGLLSGNRVFAAALLPLLVLLYFLPVWFWIGRDPELGTVVPIFDAPKEYEPGIMAFVRKMKFVPECLTSNLTQLAVLGHLKFGFGDKKDIRITKLPKPLSQLPVRLSGILNKLFPNNENSPLSMSSKAATEERVVETYRSAAKSYKSYEDMGYLFDQDSKHDKFFRRNLVQSWSCLLFIAACAYFLSDYYPGGQGFGLPPLLAENPFIPAELTEKLFGFFICFLVVNGLFLIPGLRRLINLFSPGLGVMKKFMMLVFGGLLTVLGIAGNLDLFNADALLATSLLASGAIFYLFYVKLMPAFTQAGMEVLRQAEGLRMYVNAEKEFLAQINAPEDTAEKYEEILPYAIALDAGDKWTARFGPILEKHVPQWSDGLAADILADLLILNRRNGQIVRIVNYRYAPSAAAVIGSAVWSAFGGSSGGSSGGGSGGGGGRGW